MLAFDGQLRIADIVQEQKHALLWQGIKYLASFHMWQNS